MAATGNTTIAVTLDAREDLIAYASSVGGVLRRRVSQSAALRIAVHLAGQRLDDHEALTAAAIATGLVDPPAEGV